jgi:electron transfer flavoprotein alpha subunit
MNGKQILIMAELDENRLKPSTFELSALAKTMENGRTDGIILAVAGTSPEEAAREAAARTGLQVLCVTIKGTDAITGETMKDAAFHIANRVNPAIILCPHSSQGADYAPGLAVRLSAACITSVTAVNWGENGKRLFSRSICGGQYVASMASTSERTVVLIQPGSSAPDQNPGQPGEILSETFEANPSTVRMTGVEKKRDSTSALDQAKVIVSAGRGIGSEENLNAIRRFAALIPGAAVAGSRPLIDMGWLEYKYQVGITGATVSPQVYLACGISGSTQHIAGMRTSGCVISINSDPYAAIFNHSDFCIVDDIIGFIEAFEDFEE